MVDYDDSDDYGQDDTGFRVALNQSSVAGLGRNPEMVAKMVRAARRLGVATSQIRHDNGADAEQRLKRREFTSLADIAPRTARWVAKDPDHASLVQDDLDNATRIEGALGYWSLAKQAAKKALPMAGKGLNELMYGVTALTGGQALGRALGDNDPGKLWRDNIDWYNRKIEGIERVKPGNRGQELAGMVFDTVAANAVTAPLGAAGKIPLLLGFAATAPGQLEDYLKAGYSPAQSAYYSLSNKAMEGLTELIGVSRLYKGGNKALRRGAEFLLGDMFGEQVNNAYSKLMDKGTLHPDLTLQDFTKSVVDTAVVTLGAAGMQGAMLHPAIKASEAYQQHQQAQLNKNFMLALGESASESKLLQRLPEKFREYVAHVKQGGAVDNVYIPGEEWKTYWQEKGADPAEMAESVIEGGAARYVEALGIGGDLVLPLEHYAEKIAPTEHHAPLLEHTRLHPGERTPREAEAALQEANAEAEQLKQEAETADAAERPGHLKVFDDIHGQLQHIGYDRETATHYAALAATRARQRAAVLGVDPFDLYSQSPLKIVRPLPEGVRRATVDTGLDPLLERLRAGDIPTEESIFGQSLLQFARDKGVKDDRGDLKSMDVDKAKLPGKKNILRKDGLSLDKLREAAVEDGYLKEGATTADLLDAIDKELRGSPVYSGTIRNQKAYDDRLALEELKEHLDRVGLDYNQLTNEQVRRELYQMGQRGELYQSGPIKRGFFRTSPDMTAREIGILKDANASTFIHELGHSWLEELKEDAALDTAPEQLKKDWEIIKAWLKNDGGDLTTEQHEQFARGAEAYVREGKAPTAELQAVFQRLKAWLKDIYKTLAGLDVKLSDDVRGVFDRLLASEEEIKAARTGQKLVELFATKEDARMTEAEFAAYRKQTKAAHVAETDKLEQAMLKELARERQAWWKSERAKVRAEVEADAQAAPVYRAIRLLSTGKMFDGSEGPTLKLSRADLVRMYGEPFLKILPRGFGHIYTREGGVHPDVAADLFGYDSGDAMVREMIEAPPMKGWIEAETDLRMRETHGDMLLDGTVVDEAVQAVHEEQREQVLRAELTAIKRQQRLSAPAVKAAEKDAAKARKEMTESLPSRDAFRMAAMQLINDKQVGDIDPRLYLAAERKAGQEAFDAVAKKDWGKAAEAKRRQLMNFHLYREAVAAQDRIDAMFRAFDELKKADVKLSQSRDVDMVNAARAILGRYGIDRREGDASSYLELVRRNNPDKYNDLQAAVDAATQDPKPWQRLTMDELNAVYDGVMNLWNLSLREKQVEIDGRTLALEEATGDLSGRLRAIGLPERRAGVNRALTKWDGMKTSLLGLAACMTRVEAWVDALDGTKPDGVFRKYLWNPVSDGVNAYRVAKKEYITRFLELVKGIEETITHDKIEAPELGDGGYTFRDKHELLGALLHSGNESNLEKLLVGRKWGFIAEDGGLDTSAWDATLKQFWDRKILTQADYDFIQAVWDLFEEIKPLAQKAHHQMYGYYFSEITAHPVNTPFGTYRGGYAPAIADPELTSKQGDRETADTITSLNNAAMFPTTGRGFTKDRMEYNKPLVLDLRLVPSHIDKTMRFIHIEPRVKDVARIVLNPLFRDELEQLNPVAVSDLLIPWLQRTARQSTEIPSRTRGGRAFDSIFRALRSRTGLQLMIGNVSNALQQFTGLALSAIKVKPTHLAGAVWRYIHGPLVMTEEIAELSPFMANRVMQSAYDTQREAEDILVNPTTAEQAHAAIVRHGYILQQVTQHTVDVITWSGAYDQAIAGGESNKEAVRRADSAVRMTQGSFNAEDMSLSETGSPFVKAFTQFYNYFNMQGNLLVSQVAGAVREDGAKGAVPLMLRCYAAFAVTAIVSEVIAMGFRGGPDPDDEPLDTALQLLVFSQLRTAAAMVPFGGSMANATINFANTKRFDDRISSAPFASMAEALLRTFVQYPVKLIRGEEIDERRAVRDTLNSVGLLTGVPVGPLGRPLGYLAGWLHEEQYEPSGPLDATRGLITGTPSPN